MSPTVAFVGGWEGFTREASSFYLRLLTNSLGPAAAVRGYLTLYFVILQGQGLFDEPSEVDKQLESFGGTHGYQAQASDSEALQLQPFARSVQATAVSDSGFGELLDWHLLSTCLHCGTASPMRHAKD